MLPLTRIVAATLAVLALFLATRSHAIPAFARRYETSCQTCHIAFPRLTPFGEAFRRNAYRFPDGGDATAEKEEPLTLGNEAMRERFPDAVWPGQMPRSLPLSLVMDGNATFGPEPELHAHSAEAMTGMAMEDNHDLGQLRLGTLGGHVGLRAGGSLGEFASVFASVDVGGHEPIAVERGFVVFTPTGPTALHVRVGRFEPELHGMSIHRGIFNHQLRLTTATVGLDPWAPEPNTTGIELSGVAWGRAAWAVGAVENTPASTNLRKDVYARVEGKWGGMRLDGRNAQAGSAAWRERSVSLGASAWSGKSSLLVDGMPLHDDDFLRVGMDLHAIVDDLLLDVVALRQRNDRPDATLATAHVLDLALAELTWMASAVVFPTARVEASRLDHGIGKPDERWLGSLLVTGVVRPNMVLRLSGDIGAEPGDSMEFRAATVSFATAF
jgi:hypothetical protein